jgi:hypothetical protein
MHLVPRVGIFLSTHTQQHTDTDTGTHRHPHPHTHTGTSGQETATEKAPTRVYFRHHDIMLGNATLSPADCAVINGTTQRFDVITCMSVTKWIHLNHGDTGIAHFFKACYEMLNEGGLLIVEPQPWRSYQRRRHVSPMVRSRFEEGPEMIRLRPECFAESALPAAGFRAVGMCTLALSRSHSLGRSLTRSLTRIHHTHVCFSGQHFIRPLLTLVRSLLTPEQAPATHILPTSKYNVCIIHLAHKYILLTKLTPKP